MLDADARRQGSADQPGTSGGKQPECRAVLYGACHEARSTPCFGRSVTMCWATRAESVCTAYTSHHVENPAAHIVNDACVARLSSSTLCMEMDPVREDEKTCADGRGRRLVRGWWGYLFWYAILTCRAVISDHVGMVVRPCDSCAVAGSVGGFCPHARVCVRT